MILVPRPNPPPTHLVDELVEGMLPVGSRLTPHNRTRGMVHLVGLKVAQTAFYYCTGNLLSSPGDIFAIALHISLLEVGCKPEPIVCNHLCKKSGYIWMLMMLAAAIIRPVQILIVGQQGMRLSTKEVAIPGSESFTSFPH